MDKKNILFIQPVFYRPELPNFKDKFEMLSERCRGHIISISGRREAGINFGEFSYQSMPEGKGPAKYLIYLIRTVLLGLKADRAKKFDFVHSYDPVFNGLAASIISLLTGARLIVEVNGDYAGAAALAQSNGNGTLKKFVFMLLVKISLRHSRTVKFLNEGQRQGWASLTAGKKTAVFHDFVPTHAFDPGSSRDGRYILFMGHPFHLKGVDVLIKAFMKIASKFPDIKLKIVGHCPDNSQKKFYEGLCDGSSQVEILPPVLYDKALKLFQDCTFFVLPSRSEAMGRVLIEAMACGKPVIGSNVGGIPEVIEDNGNGFLFRSCDADDLAEKMDRVLSDSALRDRMGKRSQEMVAERFSSRKYAERFYEMLA